MDMISLTILRAMALTLVISIVVLIYAVVKKSNKETEKALTTGKVTEKMVIEEMLFFKTNRRIIAYAEGHIYCGKAVFNGNDFMGLRCDDGQMIRPSAFSAEHLNTLSLNDTKEVQ